jgi:surfactin family lipopeptide synthetase A/lichenysin synthetase A
VLSIAASGRSGAEGDRVVGYLANMLPLRWKMDPAWSFAECVESAKEVLLDALDHDTYTIAELVRKVNPVRDSSARMPLGNVGFNLDRIYDRPDFARMEAAIIPVPLHHAGHDLFFNAIDTSDSLLIEARYRTDRTLALFLCASPGRGACRQQPADWRGLAGRRLRACACVVRVERHTDGVSSASVCA